MRSAGRTTRLALLAGLATIVLGACPAKKEASQPSASPTPTATATASTPWQLVTEAGTVLTLRVYDGGCFTFRRLDVQEGDREVVIAAESTLDTSGRLCPSDLRGHDERVTLNAPLGSRELKHAPLSAEAQRFFVNLPSPRPTPS